MRHLASIKSSERPRALLSRALGRFYTPELVGRELAQLAVAASPQPGASLRVIDPFCGDGRLVEWLIDESHTRSRWRQARWHVALWDVDPLAVAAAVERVRGVIARHGLNATVEGVVRDSFLSSQGQGFDVVITNPPWEVLKPDRRDHAELKARSSDTFAAGLRRYDAILSERFPAARPIRRFSGWGLNLARVGVNLAVDLTAEGGVTAVVTPPSLFADQTSQALRESLLARLQFDAISYYPAEARLFDGVDQAVACFAAVRGQRRRSTELRVHGKSAEPTSRRVVDLHTLAGLSRQRAVPIGFGVDAIDILEMLARHDTFDALGSSGLWAGRELDETGHTRYLSTRGQFRFLKGRMVGRYVITKRPTHFVSVLKGPRVPTSAGHERIAWRDVSRPSQTRRMQATLIPDGWVTGNSLGVAYFRDGPRERLLTLLGVMNSLVFEFQMRCLLSTGHISLGTLRQVRIPPLENLERQLPTLVTRRLRGEAGVEATIEAAVADAYGLGRRELERVIGCFDSLGDSSRDVLSSLA